MKTVWKGLSAVLCVSVLSVLAGCGGADAPPANGTPISSPSSGPLTASVYVIQGTSNSNDQILTFAAGSTGSTTPSATLTTNLSLTSVAIDAAGQIYAGGINMTTGVDTVNVYAAGSSGTATPTRTITLAAQPIAITTDAAGSLYVSDTVDEIVVYASSATGTATPTRTIAGGMTTLGTPIALAVDSAGEVYVSSYVQQTNLASILVFASGANGNVAPGSTILAPTGTAFFGVAVDAAKNIYADTDSTTGTANSTVVEYSAGSSGAATPVRTITGASTLLSSGSADVGGLEVDSAGNIYLPVETQGTNSFSYSLLEFGSTANGNVAPTARISSSSWINAAAQIAVH